MTSTGKRPYICKLDDCNRAFARRNTYLKHHKKQHPQIPAPSTAAGKNTLHLPLGPRSQGSSSGTLQPGPPGPDGAPAYYLRTPSTSDTPHGVAASHPPGSAASIGGGGLLAGGDVGQRGTESGGGSGNFRVVPGGLGIGGGLQPVFIPNPAAFTSVGKQQSKGSQRQSRAQGRKAHSSDSSLTTPLTTYDGFDTTSASVQTPTTPLTAVTTSSTSTTSQHVLEDNTGTQPQYRLEPDSTGHSFRISPGLSSAASSTGTFATFPGAHGSHTTVHQILRSSSTGGMMFYRPETGNGRAVSDPINMRGAPYTSVPWVGGGFSASQLSIPASHQAQLTSSYYPQLSTTPIGSAYQSLTCSPTHSGSRDDSPEPELVDINSVPQFSFQAPGGQPMSVPLSAVHAPSFNTLNPPQQLVVMPQQDSSRLHSAPPSMQRFHSSPAIPTLSAMPTSVGFCGAGGHSTGISGFPVYQQYQPFAALQSYPMATSRSLGSGDWDTGIPTLAPSPTVSTPGQANQQPVEVVTEEISRPPTAVTPQSGSHWGQPIAYPQPPRSAFASTPSTMSTTSTLVNSVTSAPSMYSRFGPLTTAPLPYPTQQHASHQQFQTSFTPAYWQPHRPALGSPVDLVKPGQGYQTHYLQEQQQQYYQPPQTASSDEQNITLTTPPHSRPKAERTVSSVGLGIANVHLGEDEQSRIVKLRMPHEEGEDEMDDDLDEYDVEEDDGSDEEFVLGGNKKKKATKKGKKGGRGRASLAVSRRKTTA